MLLIQNEGLVSNLWKGFKKKTALGEESRLSWEECFFYGCEKGGWCCSRDEGCEALAHESLFKPCCAYASPLGILKSSLQFFVTRLKTDDLMARYR
jgi:hypothetical protein